MIEIAFVVIVMFGCVFCMGYGVAYRQIRRKLRDVCLIHNVSDQHRELIEWMLF